MLAKFDGASTITSDKFGLCLRQSEGVSGTLMKLVHGGLIAVALFVGITGVGTWVLRSEGGFTKEQGPAAYVIMGMCSVFFVAALGISARLRNGIDGINSIAVRTLFLCGICGLLVLLFFLLTSRGLRIGILPYCLVGALACGALLFGRREVRSD